MDYNPISAGANLNIRQGTTGGGGFPLISLFQNDTATGSCNMRLTKNSSTTGSALGEVSFYGRDANAGNPYREFARIRTAIRNNTLPTNIDGSIDFLTQVNGTLTELMRINGQNSEIEFYQPIDLNDNDIKTATGDIELNASASTGNGKIILRPKQVLGLETISVPLNSSPGDEFVIEKAANMTNFYQSGGATNTNAQMRLGFGGVRIVTINPVAPTFGLDNAAFQTATHQFVGTDYNLTLPSAGEINFINANLDMNGGSITTTSSNQTNTFNAGSLNIVDTTNPSSTEQVDINATSITFQSSGSASDSLSFYNNSANGGEIDWSNVSGTNGLAITSSHSLTLKATASTYPIELDSDVINLKNTNTTTSTPNHNADIKATSSGLETNKFLKVQLNGADIWIPYFTSDPSL